QPSRFRAVAPLGEHLAQPGVAQLLLSALVALFLQRQPLVVDEPARTGEAAHLPLLLAVWSQFVFEGLEALHADIIIWPMSDDNDIRHGQHCVFKMHVHLVFVAKYRRRVFDGDDINRLRTIFAKVCADFHRAPVHRTAADSTLKSKDGYAVRAILPRPERRGLSRTGSGTEGVLQTRHQALPGLGHSA